MLMIYCQNTFVEIYNGYTCVLQADSLEDIPSEIWEELNVAQQMTIIDHFFGQ